MLVASAVFPIEGRPARIEQVGPVQAAQQLVEVEQARRHAGELAGAMIRGLGGGHASVRAMRNGLKPPSVWPVRARGRRASSRRLRSAAARSRRRRPRRRRSRRLSPRSISWRRRIEVVNGPAERAGVDDMHGRCGEPGEIGRAAGFLHAVVLLDIGLERDGAHDLAALDQARERIEELAVQRVGEMFGPFRNSATR